jgi:hypothetical protein
MIRRTSLALASMLAATGCASDLQGPGPARAELSVTALSFSMGTDTASFLVRNRGESALEWTGTCPATWVRLEPANGDVAPGDSVRIRVTVDRGPVAVGTHDVSVTVASNAFPGFDQVRLSVIVGPAPVATIVRADTIIAFPNTEGTIVLANQGKSMLHWQPQSSVSWLSVSPLWGGSLEPGQSTTIAFAVDRSALPRDSVAQVTIVSDDTSGARVVRVRVEGTPEQVLLPLPGPISHSYVSGGALVMTSGATLLAYHFVSGAQEQLTLPGEAAAVAQISGVAYPGGFAHIGVGDGPLRIIYTQSTLPHDPVAIAWERPCWGYIPQAAADRRLVLRCGSGNDILTSQVGAPPEDVVAGAGALFVSSLDGVTKYTMSQVNPPTTASYPGIPFAARHRHLWYVNGTLVTSSGAVVSAAVPTVVGQVPWPEPGPAPAIRGVSSSANPSYPSDTRLYVVRDSLDGQPAPPRIWEYDIAMSAQAIDLPTVTVDGQRVQVEPFAAYHVPQLRRLYVIQRARTPHGNGPWSVLMLRR